MTTPEQFQSYLEAAESARFEFKQAKGGYHFDELVRYCVALANEGGGKILLGVSDRRPRRVLGTYDQLEKFTPRLRDLCQKNSLSNDGQVVAFFDLNKALLEHLDAQGKMAKATELADKLRDKELGRLMNETWAEWLSQHTGKHFGLVLAGFELFFSYLDSNALALVRQYAINGKHLCLVLPGAERDRQVWAFDETPEFRRQITGLVSEWTYVLTMGG